MLGCNLYELVCEMIIPWCLTGLLYQYLYMYSHSYMTYAYALCDVGQSFTFVLALFGDLK